MKELLAPTFSSLLFLNAFESSLVTFVKTQGSVVKCLLPYRHYLFTKCQISRLVQIETFADDKLNLAEKLKIVFARPAFSPFPTMFSKGFYFWVV